MKLSKARVTNYKSIDDSGWVSMDQITCLVGKNESGKTAFLKALQKLSPVKGVNGDFDILDYPRKGFAKYRQTHEENPAKVICCEFELTNAEILEIESALGQGIMTSKIVEVSKNYANNRNWTIQTDESIAINHLLAKSELMDEVKQQVASSKSINELENSLIGMKQESTAIESFLGKLSIFKKGIDNYIINEYLVEFLPKFVYFDDYSTMKGRTSVQYLKQRRDQKTLDEAEQTFLSLLSLAGTELEDFENQENYERLKAELEVASISITDEVFRFWSQNKQLEVEFDISLASLSDQPPLNSGTILHVRIKNNRHRVTVPFDERSRGFVWFFSFLAYFSQLEEEGQDLILLLDEPGLSLHAKAQNDFLKFIDDRLANKYQVIYTTHSPFLINPNRLEGVRTVQDIDGKGTVISDDVLKNDKDTVYPLQAALGYDLAQTLFIGPNCLLVEGPSDLIYLQIFSDVVTKLGKEGLDQRWVIVPVGGADKVSTFVSLLGANKLNIAVLIDVATKDRQRIQNLQKNSILGHNSLIKIGDITGSDDADIEDIFEPSFYLKLVNGAYASELPNKLTLKTLKSGNPRIVKKVQEYFQEDGMADERFNHYLPAVYLLTEQVKLVKDLNSETIDRITKLFEKINNLI